MAEQKPKHEETLVELEPVKQIEIESNYWTIDIFDFYCCTIHRRKGYLDGKRLEFSISTVRKI